jgi:hypothetical protein
MNNECCCMCACRRRLSPSWWRGQLWRLTEVSVVPGTATCQRSAKEPMAATDRGGTTLHNDVLAGEWLLIPLPCLSSFTHVSLLMQARTLLLAAR